MVFWLHGCSCNVLQIWFRARRGAGLCPGDALGRWNLSFRPQLHQPGAVSGSKYLQLKIYFVCQERLLSEHVMSFWVNFAKTGKKNSEARPKYCPLIWILRQPWFSIFSSRTLLFPPSVLASLWCRTEETFGHFQSLLSSYFFWCIKVHPNCKIFNSTQPPPGAWPGTSGWRPLPGTQARSVEQSGDQGKTFTITTTPPSQVPGLLESSQPPQHPPHSPQFPLFTTTSAPEHRWGSAMIIRELLVLGTVVVMMVMGSCIWMNTSKCELNLKFSARGTSLSLPAPTYSSPRRALPWTGSPSSSSPSASSYSPLTSSFAALSFVKTKR